jgi:uncharacterized protein (TIGR00730 family)
MEAANRGARDAGAPSIGFNIALVHEQQPNPNSTPELTFLFQYFAIRKLHLVMRANALVIFPGGFGTLDEMFEILTLKQSKKTAAIPILLFDESFWRPIVNFDQLVLEARSATKTSRYSASRTRQKLPGNGSNATLRVPARHVTSRPFNAPSAHEWAAPQCEQQA